MISEKTYLVTGGAGFIGSNFIPYYLDNNPDHHLVNLDLLTYAGNLANLSEVTENAHYHFVKGDIRANGLVNKLFVEYDFAGVFHFAAESHVDNSITGPAAFIDTNINGTFNLLEVARKHWLKGPGEFLPGKENNRFLHVSTDEVYGDLGNDDPAFCETTPYAPSSPYAASKASADHLVRAWHRTYGLPVLITNCSNNYGPYQFPEKLIPLVIIKALAGEDIPIYGSGENIRDWLYVGDHAHALLEVLKKGAIGKTYNIGGENERSNINLVKDICILLDDLVPRNHTSYQEQISFIKDRPGHDRRYAMNITRITNDLGWSPRTKASTGLAQTVKWYIANQDWWQKILDKSAATRRQGLAPK